MASRSGSGPQLAAVDDAPARRSMRLHAEEYAETVQERWMRDQIRRERSAAYWFAASKWGFMGLMIGIAIGAFMMYTASVTTLPLAQDAVARGAAIQAAKEAAEGGYARPAPQAPSPSPTDAP